ncbi:hypothetical protein [Leeia aquatica]|uniref:Extracellular solute-binding protein n=1 Tax=Leeia aquatica TaxID=2725557 RepID=A0A847SCL5_9NEIS|nr:hypothetical protein [Leeia aquatica]NLR74888.1 hypothetical protein [Leeia aquatica]
MGRKILGVILSLALLLAVAAGIWKSTRGAAGSGDDASTVPASVPAGAMATTAQVPANCNTVSVLTGSAKFAYLQDARVIARLQKENLCLQLTKSGSFKDDLPKLSNFDAIWPAGSNAALDVQQGLKGQPGVTAQPVFSTPLVMASWSPLLPVLSSNGLLETRDDVSNLLLDKTLPLMLEGKRWNQLQNNAVFPVNKGILVNTPDLRKSNTGMLYIALLAWVRNHGEVPANSEAAVKLADELAPLMTRQGFQEGTLAGPFEDYIGQGMGKAPLVLIYESQFVEAKRQGKLRDKHVLIYPRPSLVLKHIWVSRSNAGQRVGQLLASDPDLQKIAAEYGFRTNDPKVFEAAMQSIKLPAPELIELADMPATHVLDAMQDAIVARFE